MIEATVPSAWAPFHNKTYRMLWLAQFVSNVGTWMQSVGAVWVMLELGGSPTFVALVATASSLPVVFAGIAGGALADVVDRRRLLIATQSLMLLAAGGLAILDASGQVTPSSLLVLTFVLGAGAALNGPAWQAIQPELVPHEQFAQAVTLGGASINLGRALGPAIAGVILVISGAWLVFLLNALSFGAVIAALLLWKREANESDGPSERFMGAVRAGIRFALFSRELKIILVRAGAFSVASAGLMALAPVYATSVLHLGSGGLGILLGGFGVGAVIAAGLLPRIRERLSEDAVVTIGTLGVAVALLGLAVTRSVTFAFAITLVAGAAWLLCLSTFNVSSQEALPGWVRARGLAMYLTVFMGGVAIGSAAWGYLATLIGISAALAWGALAVALSASLAFVWKLRWIGEADLNPSPMHAPEMRLVPQEASGPAFVMITYEVRPHSEEAFQEALRRVGRARRRTGAVRWSLYRDADRTDRFVESFVVPNWSEHVRQHGRRTAADASHQESLRAFLVAGADPVVTHLVAPTLPRRGHARMWTTVSSELMRDSDPTRQRPATASEALSARGRATNG